MRHAVARTSIQPATAQPTTPHRRDPASDSLDGALHPMHRELLARWSATGGTVEPKFPLPARLAVAMGGAGLAWALVGGAIWSIAQLVR